ncbi:MAG TPA: glycosyltransferase family 4 protein, partial [Syntrophaceae bacterium]|nr:glycosyltransferase family 4 protein [Syntrophaceae bacterium]
GVDTTRFYPLNKKEARIKLGLPLNNRIILGAGHLIERKGFHHLIDAIHILVEQGKYHDILTVIVGEGDFRGNLERQVARLKLELYVRLVGIKPNEELVYWYNAADIFSLVSSREGWPNVLFESLACGTPVVATAVGGTPEVINSEEYGLLVQKQEPRQIAEALEKALEKKWDTNRLIKYARENTWDKVARKVLLEFEKILSHK